MSDYRPRVGDLVSVTLHGQLIGYDAELGKWELKGQADGGHVPWTWKLHWATEFKPQVGARVQICPQVDHDGRRRCEKEINHEGVHQNGTWRWWFGRTDGWTGTS